jgi:hypothetical protein
MKRRSAQVRSVGGIEGIERSVGLGRIALVGDGGIHPRSEDFGATGMCVERDIEIGFHQLEQRFLCRTARSEGEVLCLRLVGAHQRTAAGIAENDDFLDAVVLEPFHADADVDQGMLEQELVLGAAIARVPAQEADSALGHVGREIVLGEVDVVVRCDHRDARLLSLRSPVDALARIAAVSGARHGRRGEAHKPCFDVAKFVLHAHPTSSRYFEFE